jgi:hypothetical protein
MGHAATFSSNLTYLMPGASQAVSAPTGDPGIGLDETLIELHILIMAQVASKMFQTTG